ncbi:arsenate reductase (glutaredoxin) [Rhodovarius crocodyli]|uniref:Arsenate reductase n=1 Tax=Rhodovarius crocodyli TaxID=1979269 RepID=A0A437MPH9_9PROT|nr:arsenate reductase (glutaredoxin) [Rhodovarius crocodyli]RVT99543.1 arsenate reductase (glutaredoxin) [Rhodovarius crocodyli]
MITIWHNPQCSTSRKVLDLLRAEGHEPRIVEYLKTPPSRAEIAAVVKQLGIPARGLLRKKAPPYAEMGLGDPALPDDRALDAMVQHPVLIERPVVITGKGARIGRPVEAVREVL